MHISLQFDKSGTRAVCEVPFLSVHARDYHCDAIDSTFMYHAPTRLPMALCHFAALAATLKVYMLHVATSTLLSSCTSNSAG
jgi:hypothetical protein